MGADVNCLSSIDDFSEFRAQFGVCSVAAGPESVTSDGGDSVIVQMCDTCGVLLVHEITVPS